MRESKTVEYKETVTNTFLKTVSAYANYGTGKILFGITDDGTVKGIENPDQTCLDIENRINDNIDPIPEFSLSVNNRTSVITLTVFEGLYKPYFYKSNAYRRSDSSSIAVERLELTRLILEGQNLTFEELPAGSQNLSFSLLETKLKERLQLENVTRDTLKTLELYTADIGFNKAAELLSDNNSFPGIDMVRFGDNINIILDRKIIEHNSILEQYDQALNVFRTYFQYEQIKGSLRETVYRIPEEAFRESIANALVHRTWDIEAQISVSMFDDRIEITSPGGLPNGMSEEEYYRGGISVLRNRIIGSIFFRLRLIERFGTGIRRILESYVKSSVKPVFLLSENMIRITLPVLEYENSLSRDENAVYKLLMRKSESSSSIAEKTGFGKTKIIGILKKLESEGYIHSSGSGRGTRYTAS